MDRSPTRAGVRAARDYLVYIRDEARKRFDAGMPVYEAALDIALDDYSSWGDAERIVVNVDTLYREFAASSAPAHVAGMFGHGAHSTRARAMKALRSVGRRKILAGSLLFALLGGCLAPAMLLPSSSQLMWALLTPLVGFDPNRVNLFEQPVCPRNRMVALLGKHYDPTMRLLRTAN